MARISENPINPRQATDDAWLSRSLEQIEGARWGEPASSDTPLVASCLRLRKVPIRELSLGNMRQLLVQAIGTKTLTRLVMPVLQDDVLCKAELYPGDLLSALAIAIRKDHSQFEHDLLEATRSLLMTALSQLDRVERRELRSNVDKEVRTALEAIGGPL